VHLVDITMFYPPQSGGARTYLRAKSLWLRTRTRIRHSVIAPRARHDRSQHAADLLQQAAEANPERRASANDGEPVLPPLPEPELIALPSLPVPWSSGFRWPLSTAVATRCLLQLAPTLIEAGDPYQCAWSALQARDRLQKQALIFHHSDLPHLAEERFGGLARIAAERYLQRLYREFDSVLAPSATMVAGLRALGIPRVRQQPLGVDTRLFSPLRRDAGLRARLGIAPHSCLLVYAGRFSREKNLTALVNAVRKLGSDFHLLLIGAAAARDAGDQVSVLPYQHSEAALAALLSACDVFVHPGAHETFGLVVLEAMACGLPVLGVRAGGVGELLDAEVGALIDDGSTDALCEGLRRLAALDLKRLGRQARRRACLRHDWHCVLPQLVAHYRQLAGADADTALEPATLAAG
jgi:alpha-1,6-mannosyltransferase